MRRASSAVTVRNAEIVTRIRELKADHPFWGYRRVWATLRFTNKIVITPKRVLRLMRLHQLLVTPETTNKALRTPTKSKPQPTASNQWWGIDMTKVMTQTGWSYVVIVLDWFDKHIVGYYAGDQAKADHWLSALDMAVNNEFPNGIEGHSLHLMSDNGSQPTSVRFMKVCGQLDIDQAFTSYNNPKGNADTERMMRTLKEELFWLREWANPTEVAKALDAWVPGYHRTYRHSTLRYKTPNEFKREHSPKTQLQAA